MVGGRELGGGFHTAGVTRSSSVPPTIGQNSPKHIVIFGLGQPLDQHRDNFSLTRSASLGVQR